MAMEPIEYQWKDRRCRLGLLLSFWNDFDAGRIHFARASLMKGVPTKTIF